MAHRPFARGVSSLMYVGDIPTVDPVTPPTKNELAAGAVAALVAWKSRGIVRLAAGGIAAWIGYRAYKSQ